jgi:hypothetical protein
VNDKSFIQWLANDNCSGDRASAFICAGMVALFTTGMFVAFLSVLLTGKSFVAITVTGLVFLWCALEVYHMGRGYTAHVTGDKSYKFHWSMRWRAHMYKARASKAYFNEYEEWIREKQLPV